MLFYTYFVKNKIFYLSFYYKDIVLNNEKNKKYAF